MNRLGALILAAGFAISALALDAQSGAATPFSDVPANHWAYQAIQSLAADGLIEGYPDGRLRGDRPLTRYEMAVLIARVIAKVQTMTPTGYATRADLDKLQKLIDAFKDELDALGVRVTNLEDSLEALDKRTRFAQSLEFHGFMQPDVTLRQRETLPQTVSGGNAGTGIFNAFVSTDFTNAVYTQQETLDQFRYDDKFTFVYHVTDNLTVSIPLRITTYDAGGSEFTGTLGSSGSSYSGNGTEIGVDPGVDITIARTGNISNLWIKYGIQDDIKSSRTGLTYKAPDVSDQYTFGEGPQDYEHGFSISGTLNGLTDFQGYFTREDDLMLTTQSTYPEGYNLTGGGNNYLTLVVPNQTGYSQNGYPGPGGTATQTLTFGAGSAPLSMVYLGTKALIGTVFVSSYNGTLYNSSGQIIGGGANPAPAFVYDDALNAVTFTNPLPAGSTVSITFVGLTSQNYTLPQRFHVGGRVNQKIKGLPGAEIGASFSRIFDVNDLQCSSNSGVPTLCLAQTAAPGWGFGLVSDTVFGVDAQLPIPIDLAGPGTQPVLFGEVSNSKYSPSYQTVAPVSDNAYVAGANFTLGKASATIQYQSIGSNYVAGAPFRYYGSPPPTFAYWKMPYFPAFYGFANTVVANKQFLSQFANSAVPAPFSVYGPGSSATLNYDTPMFNPFIASGPQWFSSFTPNTQGVTGNISIPFRVGNLPVTGRIAGAHLSELTPNSVAAMQYGSSYQSNVKENFDRLEAAVNLSIPAFGKRVAVGGSLGWDRLYRNDQTLFQYYPFNPTTGGNDPGSVAAATTLNPALGSTANWTPNYINVNHLTTNVSAAMPVTKGLVLSGLYNQQSFTGDYQTLMQNISQKKTFSQGALTYTIPNTPSTLTFFFRTMKYTDFVVPSYDTNINREDIIYAIRF
ncbi:MAG TPA: S-layer homology domain-containing protein [Candidatus Baltobacteraceae bacterium]|jgi:hypothetical protein